MNLHLNKELFDEIIGSVAIDLGLGKEVILKDY